MKIIDENGAEITEPDLSAGHLEDDYIIVHHDAVVGVEELSHYEVVAEYASGGKDVKRVIDREGVEAVPAYDEREAVYRYIKYTAEELAEIKERANAPTIEECIADLQETVEMLILTTLGEDPAEEDLEVVE